MGRHQISFIGFCILLHYALCQENKYNVRASANSELVNIGEDYVAYCNIPNMGALDIITNLKVQWLHNGSPLTSLCELVKPELYPKYSCKVLSPQNKNISLELTISDIKPEDGGILECDVVEKIKVNGKWVRDDPVVKLPVEIKVREPIKSLVFKFDSTSGRSLTLCNNEAPHRLEVRPGKYSPSCAVEGSMPLADLKIMNRDVQMPGQITDWVNQMRTEFVADAVGFKGNMITFLVCSAEVPGLPNSRIERTYQIVVKALDPKFMCSNNSAIVNNKRHVITCNVYGVEGIKCYRVTWQIGDDEEYLNAVTYNNMHIACKEVDEFTIETTLEIQQVTAEVFKTQFRVIYNDSLAGTIVHQVSIPQELRLERNIEDVVSSTGINLDDSDNALLAKKLCEFLLKSKSVNTCKKYMSSFNKWCKFIKNKNKPSIPANPVHISLFITYLMNIGSSYHVISSSIYSIKWAHSILGYTDPTLHPFIKSLLDSSKRHNKPRIIKKEPVSTSDLIKLCDSYKRSRNLADIRDLSMILIFFAGFLRFDELSSLVCSDIVFMEDHMKVFIPKSKTDQYRQGNEVLIARGTTSACPVKMTERYFELGAIDSSSCDFLFKQLLNSKYGTKLINKNKKLSYTRTRECLVSKLKSVMGNVNIGLHSLRSGGATTAANSNVNDRIWKKHGRWISDSSKDGYVKDSLESRMSVSKNLGL